MKQILLSTLTLFTAVTLCGQVNLAEYSATNNAGESGVVATNGGISSAAGLTRGPGINRVSSATFYSSRGFTSSLGIDFDDYLEFSLGADFPFNIEKVTFRYARSPTGPTRISLRSSVDNYTTDLDTKTNLPADGAITELKVGLVGVTNVTFRLYAFAASSSGGTFTIEPILTTSKTGLVVDGSADSGLPVALTSFTATPVAQGARLEWAVASERDNDYFAVEVARDAATFIEVERVVGRGATEYESVYTYSYPATQAGMHYFRLRQVDHDGTTTYSPVVSANLRSRKGFTLVGTIYHHEQLGVAVEGERTLQIISLTGEVVRTVEQANGRVDIDVADLPAGMYLVTDGETSTRFIR